MCLCCFKRKAQFGADGKHGIAGKGATSGQVSAVTEQKIHSAPYLLAVDADARVRWVKRAVFDHHGIPQLAVDAHF